MGTFQTALRYIILVNHVVVMIRTVSWICCASFFHSRSLTFSPFLHYKLCHAVTGCVAFPCTGPCINGLLKCVYVIVCHSRCKISKSGGNLSLRRSQRGQVSITRYFTPAVIYIPVKGLRYFDVWCWHCIFSTFSV